jgi:hypothetical protein
MRPGGLALLLSVALLAGGRCASAPTPEYGRQPGVSPADLVAAISDVAAGRNAAMVEAGLVLKTIEFQLAVTREEKTEGKVQALVLDLGGSRASETSFLQTFTLEIPARRGSKGIAAPVIPAVTEFVEAAMNAARDLARAAAREGLPQRLREVELVAKIVRSGEASGGIAFTVPVSVGLEVRGKGASSSEAVNTLRLRFSAP